MTERRIVYRFTFSSRREKVFVIRLDDETLAMIHEDRREYPAWTALGCHRCANCPLDERETPRCPIAANLVDPIEFFLNDDSHDEIDVRVETGARTTLKKTTLQKGISALLGIFMVTSGCPIMDRLRPMVDTHLPFATADETMGRILNMYLMAQYFRARNNLPHDMSFDGLVELLKEVRQVDAGFCERLKSIHVHDASINALIILNMFGDLTVLTLESDELSRLERLYRLYLEQAPLAR